MVFFDGVKLRFGSAFFTLDTLGLHAGWRGREIVWTREFGWVHD